MSHAGKRRIAPTDLRELVGKSDGDVVARSMVVFNSGGGIFNLKLAPHFMPPPSARKKRVELSEEAEDAIEAYRIENQKLDEANLDWVRARWMIAPGAGFVSLWFFEEVMLIRGGMLFVLAIGVGTAVWWFMKQRHETQAGQINQRREDIASELRGFGVNPQAIVHKPRYPISVLGVILRNFNK